MAERPKKRRPGGQPKPAAMRKRNNLTFRARDDLRTKLERAAAANDRSVSEEIEFRLNRDFAWEATKGDISAMLAEASAIRSAARVQALRAAGFAILRETDGRPTRVVVDLETLTAEADGTARGLRSGFVDERQSVSPDQAQSMTAEEAKQALRELEDIKRRLTAASKSDDDAA